MCNATCGDTFAPSYRSLAAHEVGAVAGRADLLKEETYTNLLHAHAFTLAAVEFCGTVIAAAA